VAGDEAAAEAVDEADAVAMAVDTVVDDAAASPEAASTASMPGPDESMATAADDPAPATDAAAEPTSEAAVSVTL